MSRRAIGLGFALFAMLSGGCGLCNGVQRAWHLATWTDYNRPAPQVPPADHLPDPPKEPTVSESLAPGNAFSSIADNRFNSWTLSPRVDMPLPSKPADTP